MYLPDTPLLLLTFTFVLMWLIARLGAWFTRSRPLDESTRHEFDVIRTATLTLLGLIIGFTFSMSITRYDLRKSLEQAENRAISTEYLRAGLLPAADAAKCRELLREYLDLRLAAYRTADPQQLLEIEQRKIPLEHSLWSLVETHAGANPTPTMALVAAGMNDVLDSAGDSRAARLNRIPRPAWHLMALIAACSCALVGFGASNSDRARRLLPILPLIVAISFLLISDIDTPRGGLIRVQPDNLQRLADLLRTE